MKGTSCMKVRYVSAMPKNKTVVTPEIKHAPNKFICSIPEKTICEILLWSSTKNYQIISNSFQQSAACRSYRSIYIHRIYIIGDA